MSNFVNRVKESAEQHDKQVDQGLEKAGDAIDRRTGGKYDEQIDKGVDMAQRRTGEGDQSPPR